MEFVTMVFGGGRDLGAGQMCARAAVVFALTFVALRISGRRALGQHSTFDMVVAVLLGAVASRAVVGASEFLPTMAAVFTIVLLHRFVGWLSVTFPALDVLLNGRERMLVRAGKTDPVQMRKALITSRDLEEAARLHGMRSLADGEFAWLERNGEISLVRAQPGPSNPEAARVPDS